MQADEVLRKERLRVLKAAASGHLIFAVENDCDVRLSMPGKTRNLKVNGAVVTGLIDDELLSRSGADKVILTNVGKMALKRALSEGDPFGAQHQERRLRPIELPNRQKHMALVNETESPLAWLRRRRGRDGRPFIDDAQFSAGERLRGDFTRANMMPGITANWSFASGRNKRSGDPGGIADLTDAALCARDRVYGALDAVGPEFDGVLLDICCYLKRLEQVETERRWPARSGKVILGLGLAKLARHYDGLDNPSVPGMRGIRKWDAKNHRPSIE